MKQEVAKTATTSAALDLSYTKSLVLAALVSCLLSYLRIYLLSVDLIFVVGQHKLTNQNDSAAKQWIKQEKQKTEK